MYDKSCEGCMQQNVVVMYECDKCHRLLCSACAANIPECVSNPRGKFGCLGHYEPKR